MKEAYIFCNSNYIKPETRKTTLCKDAHLGGKTMKKKKNEYQKLTCLLEAVHKKLVSDMLGTFYFLICVLYT